MRRFDCPAAVFAAAALLPSLAYAQVSVPSNEVRRLSFSGSATDVVVGNPDIAEVTVVDGRNVFVTGRREGTTSVVVLDGAGRIVFNDRIAVGRAGGGGGGPGVTVARASSVTTVMCNPRCEDTGAENGGATAARGAAMPASPVNALRALLPQSGSAPAAQAASTAPQTAAPSTAGSAG